MQYILTLVFKAIRRTLNSLKLKIDYAVTYFKFYTNNVVFGTFHTDGTPFVVVARGARCRIGNNLRLNNGLNGNHLGRPQPCILSVDAGAELIIGNSVGMSSTAIVVHERITIDDDVKIGADVCIYDSDFHSLDPRHRSEFQNDRRNKKNKPIHIKRNAFIGAHSTILKGVCIGENSIVGACSVITKDIPDNEIWVGNPARFIRKIV